MEITQNGIRLVVEDSEIARMLMERLVGARVSVPSSTPPEIGEVWAGQGGIYAGLSLTDDGKQPCHLIVSEIDTGKDMDWEAALKWARSLDTAPGFDLPNRHDGLTLFQNLPKRFAETYHWLKTQHASLSGYAWLQDFGYGAQNYGDKDFKFRARAVRRLIIQSFSNS